MILTRVVRHSASTVVRHVRTAFRTVSQGSSVLNKSKSASQSLHYGKSDARPVKSKLTSGGLYQHAGSFSRRAHAPLCRLPIPLERGASASKQSVTSQSPKASGSLCSLMVI